MTAEGAVTHVSIVIAAEVCSGDEDGRVSPPETMELAWRTDEDWAIAVDNDAPRARISHRQALGEPRSRREFKEREIPEFPAPAPLFFCFMQIPESVADGRVIAKEPSDS